MSRTSPIGVFDSGVGGLTVFKALARRMPGEDLVYFGDTAHVPYGSKSKETVTRYSTEIARFLRKRGVKAVVVACNTSSALALEAIRRSVDVPVVGVIEPGARAAAAASRGRVGVIGTEATVKSGAYAAAIKKLSPRARVTAQACPLFVPLVEEGWWRHPVTAQVAREYLKPFSGGRVDALVLGCTHYPLLKKAISGVVGPGVTLIDSAEQTAVEVEALLERLDLRRAGRAGKREFWCSDAPDRFLRLAKRLGVGAKIARLHPFE